MEAGKQPARPWRLSGSCAWTCPGARNHRALLKALGTGAAKPMVLHNHRRGHVGPVHQDDSDRHDGKGETSGTLLRIGAGGARREIPLPSPSLLKRLNPGAHFTAGEHIRVPNVLGVAQEAPTATRAAGFDRKPEPAEAGIVKVVVSKKASILTVFDQKDKVIFHAPVTSGSEHDPLPLGNWVITLVQRNPTYNYNPDLFWDANPANAKEKIAAGPNNPVGVVWIEINKAHYGIHGTPEPGRIGYSESHGCVRLTNWDASKLAGLVKEGTAVVFEE